MIVVLKCIQHAMFETLFVQTDQLLWFEFGLLRMVTPYYANIVMYHIYHSEITENILYITARMSFFRKKLVSFRTVDLEKRNRIKQMLKIKIY